MSKEIELHISIGNDGKVTVTPKGTQGKECLDVMKFLDKLEEFTVINTTPNEDMKKIASVKDLEFESYLSKDYSRE